MATKNYYTYGTNLSNKEVFTSTVNTPYGHRRYFSSIDTDIYFGDKLMDDIVAFDFILDEKKMHIYGYNNFSPKRTIIGQKTIQGSFAINFTKTNHLPSILSELPESLYHSAYEDANYFCADDNKAIFDKGFDVTIAYGDANTDTASYNACTQTLVGVFITSYRQAFDTSGEPILDMYTFIAKDLIIQNESEPSEKDDNYINKPEHGTDPNGNEDYVIANRNDRDNEKSEENKKLYECINNGFIIPGSDSNRKSLCVDVYPMYNYMDGISTIGFELYIWNDEPVEIKELVLQLHDEALEGAYSFKLDKNIDNFFYYYEMTGTNSEVGKNIYKLFQEENYESLDCTVLIDCVYLDKEIPIEFQTSLYQGNIG